MGSLIAVTPQFDKEKKHSWISLDYSEAIRRAGGTAVVIPPSTDTNSLREIIRHCGGILFTGGPDFEDRYYGAKALANKTEPVPERDSLEFPLMELALSEDRAVLGICRGAQLLCAVGGGDLYQDISTYFKTDIEHEMKPPYNIAAHGIRVEDNTPLFRILRRKELGVNSRHHQAVRGLGVGQLPMAYAPDGVIEAIYMPKKRFVWGIQWHPEAMEDESSQRMFEAFVDAAQEVGG